MLKLLPIWHSWNLFSLVCRKPFCTRRLQKRLRRDQSLQKGTFCEAEVLLSSLGKYCVICLLILGRDRLDIRMSNPYIEFLGRDMLDFRDSNGFIGRPQKSESGIVKKVKRSLAKAWTNNNGLWKPKIGFSHLINPENH